MPHYFKIPPVSDPCIWQLLRILNMDNTDFGNVFSFFFSMQISRYDPQELCYGCPRVLFDLIAFLFQESLQLHTGPMAFLPLVETESLEKQEWQIETSQVRSIPAGQASYHTKLLTSLCSMFKPIRLELLQKSSKLVETDFPNLNSS